MAILSGKDNLNSVDYSGLVKAIVTLNLREQPSLYLDTVKPTDFSSRYAYRQALIDKQNFYTGELIQKVRKELQNIVPKVFGGSSSSVFVIEGTISQVAQVEALESVKRVVLDAPIQMH